MGKNDALRQTFRTGGEQNSGRAVAVALNLRRATLRKTPDLVRKGHRRAYIFEVDDARDCADCLYERLEVSLFDEDAGRQDDRNVGGLARGNDVCRTCREIQHGGNAAHRLEARRTSPRHPPNSAAAHRPLLLRTATSARASSRAPAHRRSASCRKVSYRADLRQRPCLCRASAVQLPSASNSV